MLAPNHTRSFAHAVAYVAVGMAIGFAGARSSTLAALNGVPRSVVSTGQASPTANVFVGPALILDGDTIEIAGERIRLNGIDAPESDQTCQTAQGEIWACGTQATQALQGLVGDQEVRCVKHKRDTYRRWLATCYVGEVDVQAWMVEHGEAWAYTQYSRTYVAQEEIAKAQHIGIWQGASEPAWEFRKHRWERAAAAAPKNCPIKGKITPNGHIYHTPWGRSYARAQVNEARGERWFCDENEAMAAGWRPALR